jgi:hypothetical protein
LNVLRIWVEVALDRVGDSAGVAVDGVEHCGWIAFKGLCDGSFIGGSVMAGGGLRVLRRLAVPPVPGGRVVRRLARMVLRVQRCLVVLAGLA